MSAAHFLSTCIRNAVEEDAEPLAKVHIQAWRETYRGIMPDQILDDVSVKQRTLGFRQRIRTTSHNRSCLVIAVCKDELVGFASSGPTREQILGTDGEIYAINLLNDAKHKGIGRQLMHKTATHLADQNFQSAGLWVLEANLPAVSFYNTLAGTPGTSIEREIGGKKLTERAIFWSPTQKLISNSAM